jgi:hypothetical protein
VPGDIPENAVITVSRPGHAVSVKKALIRQGVITTVECIVVGNTWFGRKVFWYTFNSQAMHQIAQGMVCVISGAPLPPGVRVSWRVPDKEKSCGWFGCSAE